MKNKRLYRLRDRALVQVKGSDAFKFLQNLVTNDLSGDCEGLIYSALLTPQGKYLFDFFIIKKSPDWFLIDISSKTTANFIMRLNMYKLRSNVSIEELDVQVILGFSFKPDDAFFDPRCIELGWRQYIFDKSETKELPIFIQDDYDKLRVDHCIPETNIELIKDKTFILEAGFERLSGVSFTKGCYIGQEVTARMRHKTKLQKGFAKVKILGDSSTSKNIILFQGKVVGSIYTRVGDYGLAYLKYKYEKSGLNSGNAEVILIERF